MNRLVHRFSQNIHTIPIINLSTYLEKGSDQSICEEFAFTMKRYGCAILFDPRISEKKNQDYLDLMEKYFNKRQSQMDKGYKIDIYPEL